MVKKLTEARQDNEALRERWISLSDEMHAMRMSIDGLENRVAKLEAELNLLRG